MDKQKEIMELLLIVCFKHQIQLKMFHFQTKKYGAHKASDKYLDDFNTLFDKLMEVTQGIFGKVTTTNININCEMLTDDNINEYLNKFVKTIRELDNPLSKYSELLNIRDEIIANANQLKYLLTFT